MRWTRRTYGTLKADREYDKAWTARVRRRREAWASWRQVMLPVTSVEVEPELVRVYIDAETGELLEWLFGSRSATREPQEPATSER